MAWRCEAFRGHNLLKCIERLVHENGGIGELVWIMRYVTLALGGDQAFPKHFVYSTAFDRYDRVCMYAQARVPELKVKAPKSLLCVSLREARRKSKSPGSRGKTKV